MANPTGVTAGNLITETWGDAVVSRVVGIYASTAAAETDGRTEAGSLITLTDGSVWVKVTSLAGNWARIHTMAGVNEPSDVTPSANTWTDFGTITIAAGSARSMHCVAQVGFTVKSTTTADVESQIRISRDGGTTYAGGPIQEFDSVSTGARQIGHPWQRTIAPTGNWVIKHRVRSTQSNTTFQLGCLTAQVIPDLP